MQLKITDIIIGERQRIDLGDLSDLDSMSDPDVGQILPIIIDQHNVLTDGRRRLAKAVSLGWTHVRVEIQDNISELSKQKKELFADVGRKDRTWQEKCIAISKLYYMIKLEKEGESLRWGYRQMAEFMGTLSIGAISDWLKLNEHLRKIPQDLELWTAPGYVAAIEVLRQREENAASIELDKRRARTFDQQIQAAMPVSDFIDMVGALGQPSTGIEGQSPVQLLNTTNSLGTVQPQTPVTKPTNNLPRTLAERAMIYNKAYAHLGTPNTPIIFQHSNSRDFIHAFWFVGGGNISDLYGSYQVEYLKRITTLFPETGSDVVHLFVGGIPASPDYVRVGLPQTDVKPDIECDAHQLSSFLKFKPRLIFADPPYSVEDSEHYANSMINRERVMSECGIVMAEGGYLVWLDQSLPIFDGNLLQFVGAISMIRSTGNRFRVVSIFKKVTSTLKT